MSDLRIISSGALRAADNMAVDEALMRSLAAGASSHFLRFYRWVKPTLSFGYFQRVEEIIDFEEAGKVGTDVVRRLTGGKMVFHSEEITFSLGINLNSPEFGGIRIKNFGDLFRELMTPILKALISLGLPAGFGSRKEVAKSGDRVFCYGSAVGHSIFAGGKKLIGAAGIKKGAVFALHGSIPIKKTKIPPGVLRKFMPTDDELSIAYLSDLMPSFNTKTLEDAVNKSYSESFGMQMLDDSLSEREKEIAEILSKNKYEDIFWKGKDLLDCEKLIETIMK